MRRARWRVGTQRRRCAATAIVALALWGTAASAQQPDPLRAGVARRAPESAGVTMSAGAFLRDSAGAGVRTAGVWSLREHLPPKRFAALVSALVPGGGQYMLGDQRFIAYL